MLAVTDIRGILWEMDREVMVLFLTSVLCSNFKLSSMLSFFLLLIRSYMSQHIVLSYYG
jgi:hypothetical protein